jgi:hypothetical protein
MAHLVVRTAFALSLALVSVRKEVESLESDVILCEAPALEVPYVDIGEPLPV